MTADARARVDVSPPPGYRIVLADESHIAGILAVERSCFADPWSEPSLRSELANAMARYHACFDPGGEIAGFCGYWGVEDEAQIMKLATAPAFRRLGVASALLSAALADARGAGRVRATLEVMDGNVGALSLYGRFGFVAESVRKGYYAVEGRDAINLSCLLRTS